MEIQSLEPGTEIEVILRNQVTVEGNFRKADEKNLYLNIEAEEKIIKLYNIKSVEVPDLTKRWLSIGIGYAIDCVLFYYLVLRPMEELVDMK